MPESTTRLGAEPELRLTRMFDAPRQLVWDAWTRPEHLERWQGAPEGMTVTLLEKDLRPGGRFKLCMRAPDGAEYWLQGEYLEVVPPERLIAAPDCGCVARGRAATRAKLRALVLGAEAIRLELATRS